MPRCLVKQRSQLHAAMSARVCTIDIYQAACAHKPIGLQLMAPQTDTHRCQLCADMVQVVQAPAPQAALSSDSNSTTLHSTIANVSTDTSCSVNLQETTQLCEALPGYLADMSRCAASAQTPTWNLSG